MSTTPSEIIVSISGRAGVSVVTLNWKTVAMVNGAQHDDPAVQPLQRVPLSRYAATADRAARRPPNGRLTEVQALHVATDNRQRYAGLADRPPS